LSDAEQKQLVKRDTTNADAYQFYLRGRYFWNKRTADGLERAIEQFRQAIDRDPSYALGYVGLADSYLITPWYADVPESETLPKAKAAADRALQIEDSLAEAHTSLAAIYQNQWRWSEAEAQYKRAISLNPNYPTAHQWFAGYLRVRRQFDDSLREIKRGQELDPLSPVIGAQLAEVFLLKNNLASAIEQCQKVIDLDPTFPVAHETLSWAYIKQRRYEEATNEIHKAVDSYGRSSRPLSYLGICYALAGKRAEAFLTLKELEARYARRESLGHSLASVHAALGDKDQAFQWLERDFRRHSSDLQWIQTDLALDDLRSDSRYADLVRRMGL
jgi:tetratricopeptide (TPR) repeat protein